MAKAKTDALKKPLRLEYRKPSELAANPANWRRHPKQQLQALSDVIAEVGWAGVLLYNERTKRLIDGHARKEIAAEDDEPVPVVIGSWTEVQERTILATLDPLGAMAEADSRALESLLAGVSASSAAIGAMLADLRTQANVALRVGAGGDEFDATPEEDGPTRTKPGELWVIGNSHRLFVGDCTVSENVERLMKGAKPFLMVTDPPYGVEYDPEWRHRAGIIDSGRTGRVANDDKADWSSAWKLFSGDVVYVWHASLHIAEVQRSLLECGFLPRSQVIWVKQQLIFGRGHYHWRHEPCWYAVRDGATANWSGDRKQSTVWEIANPLQSGEEETVHGTQKPLECMARPIRNHGSVGDIVYDPFLGSGTTLIAAHRLGRVCYGCELDQKYADVILKRAEAEGLSCEKVRR